MDDQIKPTTTPDSTTPTNPTADIAPDPAADNSAALPPADAEPITPLANLEPASGSKPPKNMMRWVLIAVVLLVAAGAVFALTKINKPDKTAKTATVSKTVALLKFGVTQPFPTSFYPNIDSSILPLEVNNQIFEGLTKYANGNQIEPNLAQSWTNPNSTTWSFKLANNVKFHNGTALTAAAVKSSLEALEKSDVGSSYTGTIKDITAPDSSTVQITTSTPDPLLPSELANLWIYDTSATTANDPANGTGPYTIKPGTSLTTNSLQLIAYETYHGGSPQVKELDFKFYKDTDSEVADLKQKALDMADLGSQSAVAAVASYGYSAYGDKSTQVYFLMPNTLKADSPLAKVAVRKALYEAIDPAAVAKADGRTGTPATQLVPQEIPGFNPAVTRPKTDATQAKTDLATAGYPNGFTITFTYFAPHQALAEEVQKELAAAGIKLTLDPQTDGKALGKKALGGQTDLFYYGYGSSLIDSSDVIQPLVVDTANYKNTAIDDLYTKASTTFDSKTRLGLLEQINKAAMDDVAVFPLYVPDASYFAVKSNLVVQTDNLTNYAGVDFRTVHTQ